MLACLTPDGLPDGLLSEFQRLSREGKVPPRAAPGHTSGWGAYASDFGTTTLHFRMYKDAWDDPSFQTVARAVDRLCEPWSLTFHLRKAYTGGKGVVNGHPFVVGERAFMTTAASGAWRTLSPREAGGPDRQRDVLSNDARWS